MLGQWENAIEWFKNRNENIVDHLLLDKRKLQTTSKMFDLLDTTHKLTEKSIVLEIGCGMARNLREARSLPPIYPSKPHVIGSKI